MGQGKVFSLFNRRGGGGGASPGPFWGLPQSLVPCPFRGEGYPKTGVSSVARTGVPPGSVYAAGGTPRAVSRRMTFLFSSAFGRNISYELLNQIYLTK